MSERTVTFTDLLRRAQAHEPTPADTQLYYFCPRCGAERLFGLVAETATQEIYVCLDCGCEKVWTVR